MNSSRMNCGGKRDETEVRQIRGQGLSWEGLGLLREVAPRQATEYLGKLVPDIDTD